MSAAVEGELERARCWSERKLGAVRAPLAVELLRAAQPRWSTGAPADGGTGFVPRVGESIPLTLGGELNINTASERDFRYAVGSSAEIAPRMVASRTAHGPFTAISLLLLAPIR